LGLADAGKEQAAEEKKNGGLHEIRKWLEKYMMNGCADGRQRQTQGRLISMMQSWCQAFFPAVGNICAPEVVFPPGGTMLANERTSFHSPADSRCGPGPRKQTETQDGPCQVSGL
jgi:hypothetical protein